jgi:FixJ family two-component response regulator
MTRQDPIVYVLDDEPAVLKAVGRLLRAAGFRTAEFPDAAHFLQELSQDACGCIVLDYSMPRLNGLEVQDELKRRGVSLPIIFLTGHADVPTTVRAMKGGAAEFLTKPIDEAQLITAAQDALERDHLVRDQLDELASIRDRVAMLTPREREVMRLVVAGKLNKQAAQTLGTAEKTIKVHRARVMEKMGAASLADLVRMVGRIDQQQAEPERGTISRM